MRNEMPNRAAVPDRIGSFLSLAFLLVWELHVLSQHACDCVEADNIHRRLRKLSALSLRVPTTAIKNIT